MNYEIRRLETIVKEQAEVFLLDAGEFYPFGSYINERDEIKPLGAYVEDDNPSSIELINILERHIEKSLENGDCKVAVVGIDVIINDDGEKHSAIEMRFFQKNESLIKKHYYYTVKKERVEFKQHNAD